MHAAAFADLDARTAYLLWQLRESVFVVEQIGRVAVVPSHRGRGLADALLRAALDVVAARPCRLAAQSYLVGWYARFGFAACGEEFLEDGIPHVPMLRPAP